MKIEKKKEKDKKTEKAPPNELDKKYTPPMASVLNDAEEIDYKQNDELFMYRNSFSFNPTLLTRKIVAINYERMVAPYKSLSFGLGATFEKDMIMGSTALSAFADPVSDIDFWSLMENSNSRSVGIYFSPNFRFYLDDYQEGGYLDINTRFYNHPCKLSRSLYGESEISEADRRFVVSSLGLNLLWGYQYLNSRSVSAVHNFYIGLGVKSIFYNKYSITFHDPSNTQTGYIHYTNGFSRKVTSKGLESIIVPSLMVGYSFGLGF